MRWMFSSILLSSILYSFQVSAFTALSLGPGVNLPVWSHVQGKPVTSSTYKLIAQAGFKLVRQPIGSGLIDTSGCRLIPGVSAKLIKQAKLSQLNGLTYVVDLHPGASKKRKFQTDKNGGCLSHLWVDLSDKFEGGAGNVVFEILNEPKVVKDVSWWSLQDKVIQSIRSVDSGRVIFASADASSYAGELIKRKPYSYGYVVYVFHDYNPMKFTHQGAKWGARKYVNDGGTKWVAPHSFAAARTKRAYSSFPEIHKVALWAQKYHVKVICDEFGVYKKGGVGERDRLAYFSEITRLFNSAGIPWTIWQLKGGFGIMDTTGRTFDKSSLKALHL